MTKTLELRFKTAEGKNRTLTINRPKEGLSKEVIEESMDTIVQQALFSKDSIDQYHQVQGARYVTREVEDIFAKE